MNRRIVIKNLAVAALSTMSGPELLRLHRYLATKNAEAVNDAVLAALCETILPETETPGAIQAGVPQFIMHSIEALASPEEKAKFENGLQAFNDQCLASYSKTFDQLDDAAKVDHLTKLMVDGDSFFEQIKGMTLFGYFTSELGMTQALEYNPIPGSYDGRVPVTEDTKAEAQYF